MLCERLTALPLGDMRIVCQAAGQWPGVLATVAAGLIGCVVVLWVLRHAQGAAARVGGVLSILAALLLAAAAGLPVLQPQGTPPSGGHITVLIDSSESVRRGGAEDLAAARDIVAEHLRQMARTAPEGAPYTGSVLGFSSSPSALASEVPLRDLPSAVRGSDLGAFGMQSDLETALRSGLARIAQGSGPGMIFLLSDGQQTRGDALLAALAAQEAGVPIHVLGVGSDRPAMGLLSQDVGPDQAIGRMATVRTTIQGSGQLNWTVNGKAEPEQTVAAADAPRPVRMPVAFAERGLNFVSLDFALPKQDAQRAVLHTLVRGPARVLVYGDAPWVAQADPTAFLIDRVGPRDMVTLDTYDAIVIDALTPSDFAADMPQRLLEATTGGTGLFLVNGPQRGSVEDEQRIADWGKTAIDPILPVSSDSVEYVREPPRRDVLIIIDTSGSMQPYMTIAKAAALKIIASVRPQDTLAIMPFTADVNRELRQRPSTPSHLDAARQLVRSLTAAGGTNAERALQKAQTLQGNSCAMFFIGDGEGYDKVRTKPACYTTSIGVANATLDTIDTQFGEALKVRTASELSNFDFNFFQPEPRDTFWQDGPLRVISNQEDAKFPIPVPVDGIALSYPRVDARDLSVMEATPRSPVLAFRRDPDLASINTGVFLGVVPPGLRGGTDGWASSVLRALIGWDAPDKYDIDFDLIGDEVSLRVTLLGDGAVNTQLSASILQPDGTNEAIFLEGPDAFGRFAGTGRVRLSNTPSRGILILNEGVDERQAIPLRLPARQQGSASGTISVQEAFGFGINDVLLSELKATTFGVDLRTSVPRLRRAQARLPDRLLWPWLAGLAAVLFAASLFFGGVRR